MRFDGAHEWYELYHIDYYMSRGRFDYRNTSKIESTRMFNKTIIINHLLYVFSIFNVAILKY